MTVPEQSASTAVLPKLKFSLPGAPTEAPPLPVPAAPVQPIASGLATISQNADARQGIVCKDMLDDESELMKIRAEAEDLLPKMLQNTQVVHAYGLDALDGLNRLIDEMMALSAGHDSKEVRQIVTNFALEVKSIKGKYDLTTPEGKRSFDEWDNGRIKKLFRKARNYLESMRTDLQSTDKKLDEAAKELEIRIGRLLDIIGLLDRLYIENDKSVYLLIRRIAVMEIVAENARELASNIPDDDNRKNQEDKRLLADLIMLLDIKIGEYKGRLWVAWATSPQVRMQRVVYVGEAEKLNEAARVTLYIAKLAIVQIRNMVEAQESAKIGQAVDGVTNELMMEVARQSAETIPAIMEAVQTPSLMPETIAAVTDSLVQMSEGIIQAIDNGQQRRAVASQQMAESKVVMDATRKDFDTKVVDHIIGTANDALVAATPSALSSGQ